jgi:hypothetical protein
LLGFLHRVMLIVKNARSEHGIRMTFGNAISEIL